MITIGRRQFLHNAGRLLLLPAFSGLLERQAFAAAKNVPWVHMYFPMGCVGTDWKLASLDKIPSFLDPFKKVQSKMLWMSDVANNVPGDGGHEQAGGGSMTCVTNKKDGKYDKSYATSADQLIAKAFKDNYANGAMALSRAGFQAGADCCHAFEAGLNYISWLDQGKNAPTISDPTIAMKQFFSGKKVDNVANSLADGKSVLDFFGGQVSSAKTKISKEDGDRLDQYTQALRDYEARIVASLNSQAQCQADPNIQNSSNFLTHQNTMLDLIALSLQCDVSPAITYIMDFEFSFQNYDFVGVNTGFHNITHHEADAADLIRSHRSINGHYASQFTKLVQKLSGTNDASGQPLIDKVIVSMGSGMAESNVHDRTGAIPFVMAGGAAAGLPQGKVFTSKVNMDAVMRTIMSYAGVPESGYNGYAGGTGTIVDKLKAL